MGMLVSRRVFLAASGAGIAALAPCGHRASAAPAPDATTLKGFIVSDAHFGWDGKDQPSPAVQREMIGRILRRFPDLDVFLDTGDAHHGGAPDSAREGWTDVIANGCGPMPFYYIPGNHEMGGAVDVEARCCRLGSLSCRPYYSFDLKGIHFVSLPELMMCSYVTREALEWAALDLEINRGRTAILLSHNSIGGTTLPHDDLGYRRLANSAEVMEFIRRFPDIAAWMHGHNHTWEIVEKEGRLFVSNGRIGGFDPPYEGFFGKGHLGGIHFEVAPGRLTVRGYSATAEAFFDELPDYAHLAQTVNRKTSLNPAAPWCASYGVGGARRGQRTPVHTHHAGPDMSARLFLAGVEGPVFNENPDFSVCTQRTAKGSRTKLLPGFSVEPSERNAQKEDTGWTWLDPGLTLHPPAGRKTFRRLSAPALSDGRRTYYRCAPGAVIQARVEAESAKGGPSLSLSATVFDSLGAQRADLPGVQLLLQAGRNTLEARFQIPADTAVGTVHADPSNDSELQVLVSAEFSGMTEDITVRRFELRMDSPGTSSEAPALVVDGVRHGISETLAAGERREIPLPTPLPARWVAEADAAGNGRVTWLVRHEGVAVQTRNAPGTASRDSLEAGPTRSPYSPNGEIILAAGTGAFPPGGRVAGAERLKLTRTDDGFTLQCTGGAGRITAEFRLPAPPVSVEGALEHHHADGVLRLTAEKETVVRVKTA